MAWGLDKWLFISKLYYMQLFSSWHNNCNYYIFMLTFSLDSERRTTKADGKAEQVTN